MKIKFTDTFQIDSILLLNEINAGSKYRCVIIKAGVTATANKSMKVGGQTVMVKKDYSAKAIREADRKRLFEGAPAMLRTADEHLSGDNTGINQYVGYYNNTSWNESEQREEGDLNITTNKPANKKFRTTLKKLWDSTKEVGLSISGMGDFLLQKVQDSYVAFVESIDSIQSVDVVPAGNAGGKLLSLIESDISKPFKLGDTVMKTLREKIFAFLLKTKILAEGTKIEDVTDEQLSTHLLEQALVLTEDKKLSEADKTEMNANIKTLLAEVKEARKEKKWGVVKKDPDTDPDTDPDSNTDPTKLTEAQKLLAETKKLLNQSKMETMIKDSRLPQPFKDNFTEQLKHFSGTPDEFSKTLTETQEALKKTNPTLVDNDGQDIKILKEPVEKIQLALDYMMLSDEVRAKLTEEEVKIFKPVMHEQSIKRLYIQFTGDEYMTQKIQRNSLAEQMLNAQRGHLGETIDSSTFAYALGVSMHKSLLKQFSASIWRRDWQKITNTVPRSDFKTNTITGLGGYGDLPTVNESGPYTGATQPGEEQITYGLLKRGYTENVTFETVTNDDVGAIKQIPQAWGEAAARTEYKYVFDLLINNTAMTYDSVELIDTADHQNKLTAALDETSYLAARKLLFNQVHQTSGEKLGLAPKYLIVPIDLEKTAYDLTTSGHGMANNVADFIQTWKVEPIVLAHATDVNNWWLSADKSQRPLIEMGYLNGKQVPELWTAEQLLVVLLLDKK